MSAKPAGDVTYPARNFAAVTTSDTTNLTQYARAFYVGTAGDIALVDSDGTVVIFKNAASGQLLPVRATRVNSTNTTATDIVALY